ncbi:hypothetical protein EC991_002149 [Linnemannia zychae]|nr:hypothetical protein EC991_002149 [Linnemannia zychae]
MFGKKKKSQDIQIPMDHLASDKEVFEPLPEPVDFSAIKITTKYQIRGMARRALSYHRRQRITNFGCLVVWPVVLVVLCHLLNKLLSGGSRNHEGLIRYCTNEADTQYGREVTLSDSGLFEWENNVYNAPHYPTEFEASYGDQEPCVRWFGESYPVKVPYQNATWASPGILDSYYTPSPDYGWFNKTKVTDDYMPKLRSDLKNRGVNLWDMNVNIQPFSFGGPMEFPQVVYYSTANSNIANALGATANVTQNFTSDSWPPTDPNIVLYNTSRIDLTAGILGAIPLRYTSVDDYERSENGSFVRIQYYTSGPTYRPFESKERVEEVFRKIVQRKLEDIPKKDLNSLFGGIHYDALDFEKAKVSMTMQFGVKERYGISRTYSGIRQLITMTQMTNALTRLKFKGQYVISQGIRALPYEFQWSRLNSRSRGEASNYMYPFALSFLLPIFVTILVQEKEDRHRMMMSMNGLKSGAYFLAHYAEFMVMQLILTLFFAIGCTAIKDTLFWNTNPGVLIVLFLVWAHVQVTFAFFIASLFSRASKASLVVYFFASISAILSSMSEVIFDSGTPFAWYIHPTFAFFNIIKAAATRSTMVNGLYPMVFKTFAPGSELLNCLLLLLGESVVFVLLTFYIDAVVPSEYGVRRPWHFPISGLFRLRSSSSTPPRDIESKVVDSKSQNGLTTSYDQDSMDGGDADVRAERERVRTQYDPSTTPLVIDNLYHCYPGKVEPALNGISFGVANNTVLSLLGPNGAGKSTLIHLLTGLYEPSRGVASVAGANIRTEMSLVHSRMGVCPQHDILWGDLTIADHLLFYSRLRGVPPSLEQQSVDYAIASVSLTKFRDRQVKGLSGGERRRVSIAISLLGDNRVVFLDEPSTGLDPEVRRVIWDIVNRVKVNRTIILTTHSMEEADILSDRIAIMTNGLLRCIGTNLHLKELYGSGFRLNIASKPGRLEEACQSIENQLMRKIGLPYRRIDKFTNSSIFEFDLSQSRAEEEQQRQQQDGIVTERNELSTIFHLLSQPASFPAVEDWGISQTTLEDVFINIVTGADASLTVPAIIQETKEE